MIKLVKLNQGGPLVIGNLVDGPDFRVSCAVSIIQEDAQMKFVDLLPFSDFEAGITFPKTSIEFISTPTPELKMEYEVFCGDLNAEVVEVKGEPQMLVEGEGQYD